MHPILIIAIETAMRRGELLGLKRGGEARDIPLSMRAVEALEGVGSQ